MVIAPGRHLRRLPLWLLKSVIVSFMLNRARFHETAAQQIRKQLQLLKAELPVPPENDSSLAFMAAAGFGSHVLEDDQDDGDDQLSMSFSCILICAQVT